MVADDDRAIEVKRGDEPYLIRCPVPTGAPNRRPVNGPAKGPTPVPAKKTVNESAAESFQKYPGLW
jgi:hypothetical protein